ncbi:MAG: hypothetical protein CL808_01430 [Citromicrobium sp.]|nr:hypothetical protein [Citromicrobium sp.]
MIGTSLAAVALLGALGSQTAMPERLRSSPSPQSQEDGRKVMMSYGGCVADAEPELSRAYVLADEADTDSPEWKGIVDARCMRLYGGELRMQDYYFRGALAERLIDKKLGDNALDGVAELAPVNATHPGSGPLAQTYTYMYRMGECIARTDPAGSRALFDTKIDSDKEKEAIQALSPTIAACVPQGEAVQIDRVRLRLGLATMYYRLADALATESEA